MGLQKDITFAPANEEYWFEKELKTSNNQFEITGNKGYIFKVKTIKKIF